MDLRASGVLDPTQTVQPDLGRPQRGGEDRRG